MNTLVRQMLCCSTFRLIFDIKIAVLISYLESAVGLVHGRFVKFGYSRSYCRDSVCLCWLQWRIF